MLYTCIFPYLTNSQLVRLANDAKGKGGERQFNGLVDVYVKTLKSDGIQGLYRGFVISAVGIFIYRGMYFGLYDSLKPILLGENANVFLSFILGWGVTVTAGLMSYPIDTIREDLISIENILRGIFWLHTSTTYKRQETPFETSKTFEENNS